MDFNQIFDYPMSQLGEVLGAAETGGLYKPHRTDRSGNDPAPEEARFNILIVFVEFKNEQIPSAE